MKTISDTEKKEIMKYSAGKKPGDLEISLKKLIEKSTKEKFDNEEINCYCMQAIEELCCTDAINEWVKYQVLSTAHAAIGINEKDCSKKSRFLKKAEIFRNKMPLLKITEEHSALESCSEHSEGDGCPWLYRTQCSKVPCTIPRVEQR